MTDEFPENDDEKTEDWYTDDFATFGDRLGTAREAMGWSAAELARNVGVSVESVNNWESDRSEPRSNRLQMLAGVLNVSIIWLMSGVGDGPKLRHDDDLTNADITKLLDEIRLIRGEQTALASRLMKLERRLRAALA